MNTVWRFITTQDTEGAQVRVQAFLYDHSALTESVRIPNGRYIAFVMRTDAADAERAEFLSTYQSARLGTGAFGVSGPNESRAEAVQNAIQHISPGPIVTQL